MEYEALLLGVAQALQRVADENNHHRLASTVQTVTSGYLDEHPDVDHSAAADQREVTARLIRQAFVFR